MPLRIVSIGECTVDEYTDIGIERFGGISFNFAIHAKRCGADVVSLISRAGNAHGPDIRVKLLNGGIDVSRFTIAAGNTARQKISLRENGERIFPPGGYDPGVLASMKLMDEDRSFVCSHNIVVSAYFRQVEQLFHDAMQIPFDGWRVADFLDLSDYHYDPEMLRKYHEQLSIAFVSGNRNTVRQMQQISKETECLIVVTLGPEGSCALLNGESYFEPARSVSRPVDSTGCGDAFQAAFTVSYWRHRNLQLALQCGAEQAASVIQHVGAI